MDNDDSDAETELRDNVVVTNHDCDGCGIGCEENENSVGSNLSLIILERFALVVAAAAVAVVAGRPTIPLNWDDDHCCQAQDCCDVFLSVS